MLNSYLSPTLRLRTPASSPRTAQFEALCLCTTMSGCELVQTVLWAQCALFKKRESNRFGKAEVSQSQSHISSHLFSYASPVTSLSLFLLPAFPSSFRAPAFQAPSGFHLHEVVGLFPTQHPHILANTASVCSSAVTTCANSALASPGNVEGLMTK